MNKQLNQDNNAKYEDPKIKFMLAEYNGIIEALGRLNTVILKMMNFFLIVAAVPISFVTIFMKTGSAEVEIDNLPSIVSWIFLLISIVGFIFTLILINIRMGQIRYARTANLIRRFFIDLPPSEFDISKYLNLPATDEKPEFFELLRTLFWQIILLGMLDSAYLSIFLKNLGICSWTACLIIGFFFLVIHVLVYKFIAAIRERNYKVQGGKTDKYDGSV